MTRARWLLAAALVAAAAAVIAVMPSRQGFVGSVRSDTE